MKRVIALLLVVATLMGVAGCFAGCSSENTAPLTMGAWLSMINQAFGMDSYLEEKPFFPNIDEKNPYFGAVQIAAEWGVVDSTQKLDANKKITWQDALLTLVNVGGFVSESASEEEKINYAIEHFDPSIRKYWMKRTISGEKATALLSAAQEQWATRTYDEHIEEIAYAEGVKDFSASENLVENYQVLENSVIAIPKAENIEIAAGEVFVLPGNAQTMGTTAYKAESVESDDQYLYIKIDEDELELTDIAEEIYVQNTFTPTVENSVVYDGNGNILSVGSNLVASQGDAGVHLLGNTGVYQTGTKASHTFKIPSGKKGKDFEVSLSYDLNGEFDLSASVSTPNLLDSEETELKLEAGFEISKLKVTNKIDYKWFELKEASLRVDYEAKVEGGATLSKKPIDKVLAPAKQNYPGGFFRNFKDLALKDKNAKGVGAKTIKLMSINVFEGGVARVCLDVKLVLELEGSIKLILTESGAKGLEYKKGNLRSINTSDKDFDGQLKGKIELIGSIGPALYVTGLKKAILGVAVGVGVGAEFSYTVHFADQENHLLETSNTSEVMPDMDELFDSLDMYTDAETIRQIAEAQGCTYTNETSGEFKVDINRCLNIQIYLIIQVGLSTGTYAEEILGQSVKVSWKTTKNLAGVHVENGDFIKGFSNMALGFNADAADQCTMKFTPFDKVEETTVSESDATEETNEHLNIPSGDTIVLGEVMTTMNIGEKYYFIIKQIPEGYSTKDLTCSTSDEQIVKINEDGVAVATGQGSVVVTVNTKDNKYSAYMAITVVSPENIEGPVL